MTIAPEPTSYPLVNEAVLEFLETLAGKSARTRSTYASALRRLAEYLQTDQRVPPEPTTDRLPTDLLERFYTWLVKAYGKDHRFTVQTYVAGARAFFRFLVRRRIAPPGTSFEEARANLQEVAGRVPYRTPRVDRRLPIVVHDVEQAPVPADPAQRDAKLELLRDRAIIRTLFCTGMRRAELAALNRADLDDGNSDQALISGKGERERIVFFDEPTLETIRRYLEARNDSYRPLFLRHDRGRPRPKPGGLNLRMKPNGVWAVVRKWATIAGVPITPHDFRHAKASVLLNRGARLSEVQDILGHASPETTKRIYAHYEVSHLRQAFDEFSATPEELIDELERRSKVRQRPLP
ncbi:MAG: tyrosine-type recombinase/integrase [Chloroflexi bacterium]|nr:tyrosine-type recombinase/integrase [Chloroflexota bacterium]